MYVVYIRDGIVLNTRLCLLSPILGRNCILVVIPKDSATRPCHDLPTWPPAWSVMFGVLPICQTAHALQ